MTKVKICGLTNLEDAQVAVAAGADLLGFIFYEPSPRYVSPRLAAEIVAAIRAQPAGAGPSPRNSPIFVGVFVNASFERVSRTLTDCQLDAAQLHGHEPPALVARLRGRAYKALRPQSFAEAAALMEQYAPALQPPARLPPFLLDAYHPSLYGGTGQVADWTMAARLARRYPLMLAGSLTPANVAGAIQAVKPWGVDVSSGVERDKGRKDHAKVRAFVRAAKGLTAKM